MFAIVAGTLYAQAQKTETPPAYESLFGDQISYGGYGALTLGYTQLGEYSAFLPGIKGAWIIGHTLSLGFQGAGFISELTTGVIPGEEYSFIAGGCGGFLIEPILFGYKPVHVTLPIVIGAGALVYQSSENAYNYQTGSMHPTDYDQFFMLQPGVEVELNITRFFRMALGASYRFTSDINLTTTYNTETIVILDSKDLNKLVLGLSFKFGIF